MNGSPYRLQPSETLTEAEVSRYRKYGWVDRALTSKLRIRNSDGTLSSVKTTYFEADKKYYVVPTIRLIGEELQELDPDVAMEYSKRMRDAIPFNTEVEADAFSRKFSNYLGTIR